MKNQKFEEIYERLDRAEIFRDLDPVDKGTYYLVTCPQCGKRRAYVYKSGRGLVCNRKNQCGYEITIWDYVKEMVGGNGKACFDRLCQMAGVTPTKFSPPQKKPIKITDLWIDTVSSLLPEDMGLSDLWVELDGQGVINELVKASPVEEQTFLNRIGLKGEDRKAFRAQLASLRPTPKKASPSFEVSDEEHLTDLGNAKRLVSNNGENIRFSYLWKCWFIWDGTRWAKDESGEIFRLAKKTILDLYTQAANTEFDQVRSMLVKHARQSETAARLMAMVSLAESEPEIPISTDQLDMNPWLLNCQNGTIDLETSELRPHRREDFITRKIPVAYDPKAKCDRWMKFLREITEGNDVLIDYLWRIIGYTLTGDTSEQCVFILYGRGANGKSVFLETIRELLGSDYAKGTPTETIMMKRDRAIPNDLARLVGVRMVSVNEVDEGRRMGESLVKQMTGGDVVTARFLHGEFFDYMPHYKLFVRANHKPIIRGTDHAIWRRIQLIPFTVTIPKENQNPHLKDELAKERPGILAWAVRGCQKWFEAGLGDPGEVSEATSDYKKEMDEVGVFLDDECVLYPDTKTRSKDLFKAYKDWGGGMSQRAFGMRLVEKGFKNSRTTGGVYCWGGIGLRGFEQTETQK